MLSCSRYRGGVDELRRLPRVSTAISTVRSSCQRAGSTLQCRGCRTRIYVRFAMNDRPIVIFGTGSFAQVAAVYLRKDSLREVIAYTVDGKYLIQDTLSGLPVGPFEELLEIYPPDRVDLLVATGFRGVNRFRREIFQRCKQIGYTLATYVSSDAFLMTD